MTQRPSIPVQGRKCAATLAEAAAPPVRKVVSFAHQPEQNVAAFTLDAPLRNYYVHPYYYMLKKPRNGDGTVFRSATRTDCVLAEELFAVQFGADSIGKPLIILSNH